MAVYRPPSYCYKCGKLIKAIHKNYSDLPMVMRPIGDSFLGYEQHTCDTTTERYKKWEEENEELQKKNKPLIDKLLKSLKKKKNKPSTTKQ